jgi:hypothetical protein
MIVEEDQLDSLKNRKYFRQKMTIFGRNAIKILEFGLILENS